MPRPDPLLSLTGIDPKAQRALLEGVQGNILKGHGREHAVHLHLRFTATPTAARQWIRQFAHEHLTSALAQYQASRDRHQGDRGDTRPFAGLLLSRAGYQALGLAEENQVPKDKRFRLGMKHNDVRAWLHDPPSANWEAGYRNDIHAVVVLAGDEDPGKPTTFKDTVRHLRDGIAAIADIVVTEYGHVLRPGGAKTGPAYEHFGFVDGISQPLFFNYDIERYKKTYGARAWDAGATLELVLRKDPNGGYGSYFVYRKLKQDVDQFNRLTTELAQQLGLDPEYARAQVIGRYRDGTPLVATPRKARSEVANDFTFDKDPDARRCPFHAHIRKVNPRGEKHRQVVTGWRRSVARHRWLRRLFPTFDGEMAEAEHSERARRIARRGIPYGRPDAREERGLLFLCAQANIAKQFEFLQNIWCNRNTFSRDGTGQDPLVGQAPQQPDPAGQQWLKQPGGRQRRPFHFGSCVTLQGGEYFFAPSMDSLRRLA